jgi:hypothetical protein
MGLCRQPPEQEEPVMSRFKFVLLTAATMSSEELRNYAKVVAAVAALPQPLVTNSWR